MVVCACVADYSGMSYGPEVVGFAATRGVRIESVMLRGDDTVTARLALAELKSTGVRVILSVMTPLEQFEVPAILPPPPPPPPFSIPRLPCKKALPATHQSEGHSCTHLWVCHEYAYG